MTRQELITEIRALSEHMLDVAVKMDYFGGMDSELVRHAYELAGAAAVAMTWADGMESGDA